MEAASRMEKIDSVENVLSIWLAFLDRRGGRGSRLAWSLRFACRRFRLEFLLTLFPYSKSFPPDFSLRVQATAARSPIGETGECTHWAGKTD
jgi:hypothetical protein